MATNQVYDQLKALEINNTANYSVTASRGEVGNTLTGTTTTYSTLDAQGIESVNSVAEWSKANDNAKQYFQSVVDGEATGNFATQKARVQNHLGNGFGLDSSTVDSKLFKAFDLDEAVSVGYDKTYDFSTGSGKTTSASDLVFDKTLINSEITSVSQNTKIPTFDAATQSSMGADLAAYNDINQSNKTAFNVDDKFIDFSFDAGGTTDIVPSLTGDKLNLLPEIQQIAIPAIPEVPTVDLGETKVPGFFHQDDSDPFFTNEVFVPAAFDGTEATAIEAYKQGEAADAGKKFLQDAFTVTKSEVDTSSLNFNTEVFGLNKEVSAEEVKDFVDSRPTFDARDLDKDGNVSFDEEEQAYLNDNNGLNYFEQLEVEVEKETGLPAEGAIFVGSDDYIQQLREEQAKEAEEKEALLEAFRASIADDVDPANESDLEKSIRNNEYLGEDGLALVNAGGDTFEDADGNLTNNQEVIEETIEKIERARALEKDPHLVADEKLIETARKIKEEKAEKAEFDRVNKVADDKLIETARQVQLEKDVKENAESTPLGENLNSISNQAKIEERNTLESTTALGQSRQQRVYAADNKKKASLATQLRENEIRNKYLTQINNADANLDFSKIDTKDLPGSIYNNGFQSGGRRGTNGINRGKFRNTFRQGADDPFAFSTLSYPRNLTNEPKIGHYLLFYVNVQNKTGYEYEGVTPSDGDYSVGDIIERQVYHLFGDKTESVDTEQGLGEITGITGTTENSSALGVNTNYKTSYHYEKGADKGDINYQKRQIQSGAKGNHLKWNQRILSKGRKSLTGMAAVHNTTTRITDSVALYLPSAENNTSARYQDFETGMAGFLALGGKGILDKILAEDYEGAGAKFMGMSGTVLVEALKKVAVEGVGAFTGGQGVQQAFDKAFGQTLNPYLEVAFSSMGVRSFSYAFNFTPKNEDESKDVKAIIELFRFHMLPELKGAQHRYLTLPSTFDIHYMYQSDPETARENTFYNKIATCVLTKCDVDYTPGGVQSFNTGAPVATTMTLEFMETEMLTKEKVQQGF